MDEIAAILEAKIEKLEKTLDRVWEIYWEHLRDLNKPHPDVIFDMACRLKATLKFLHQILQAVYVLDLEDENAG